jgi:hypothetical protein
MQALFAGWRFFLVQVFKPLRALDWIRGAQVFLVNLQFLCPVAEKSVSSEAASGLQIASRLVPENGDRPRRYTFR